MNTQPTQLFAATLIDELARCGVEAACLAPGSRSAPLAMALARQPKIRLFVHLDERSAAFFALGLAKASGRPVALLCTSGTAAAEFHPAVIEASYSRVPLLVLTADRPPELREIGANQTIDQARLYGGAVRWFFDPGPPEPPLDGGRSWRWLAGRAVAMATAQPPGPVHLNLPLREPLVPDAGVIPAPLPGETGHLEVRRGLAMPEPTLLDQVAQHLERAQRPLLVAGELAFEPGLGAAVDRLAESLGMPILAEPSSHLRRRGGNGVVQSYDALLRVKSWASRHQPDLILRLGATPTSKALNSFLLKGDVPTAIIDPGGGWRDPDRRAALLLQTEPSSLLNGLADRLARSPRAEWLASWQQADQLASATLADLLPELPLFEAHAVQGLARALPTDALLMVGSSLPIRAVDSFWPASSPDHRFIGNRGASGIDGLVSTGLGAAATGRCPTALLLGDLSLCHDMNGLWAIKRHQLKPLIVVCDNDGGGIFHFLPQVEHRDVFEELFATPSGLQLERVAELYDLPLTVVEEPSQLQAALTNADFEQPTMVVARFDRSTSV
ncbi:MAG: 2-succinyl-5-enolpyruvyl-6-hydroxy-3-cyclohexene-1-carboxylic-acid synthase, partial [Candidatus Dormibacteraceae bacterium]